MGQYYIAVNLDKKEYVRPHDYDNGAKLLEHSYIQNEFLGAVTRILKKEWKGDRVVWVGDYFEKNENPKVPVTYGDLETSYQQIKPPAKKVTKGFLNNEDLELSIDLSQVRAYEGAVEEGWELHPLSLLTACGNGRGGGDLNNETHYLYRLVGTWAGDHLSVTTKAKFQETRFFNNECNAEHFIRERT